MPINDSKGKNDNTFTTEQIPKLQLMTPDKQESRMTIQSPKSGRTGSNRIIMSPRVSNELTELLESDDRADSFTPAPRSKTPLPTKFRMNKLS